MYVCIHDMSTQVGTTAEVVGLREADEEAQFWSPCLVVKLLGRQRFRLLEAIRRPNGCVCVSACMRVCTLCVGVSVRACVHVCT